MKKTFKKQVYWIGAIFLLAVMTTMFLPLTNHEIVQAATAIKAKNIKSLVADMSSYERYAIVRNDISAKKQIKLTDAQKAKAAALTLSVEDLEGYKISTEFGTAEYVSWKITDKKLKQATKKLFGKAISVSKLPKVESDGDIFFPGDAYRNTEGVPLVYYTNGEVGTDYDTIKLSMKKNKNGSYKVVKQVYYGHWFGNNGTANYKITYTVKASSKSSYGCKITKMIIQKL